MRNGKFPRTPKSEGSSDESMLLALPVAIGLIVGKLTGGSFKSLATTPLQYAWLFLLGFGLKVFVFNPATSKTSWDLAYGSKIYMLSLCILAAAVLLNVPRLSWPIYILAAGALLNFAVIFSNGGAMPVQPNLLAKAWGPSYVTQLSSHQFINDVQVATSSTRLGLLDDRFLISTPIAPNVYSIGDILIGVGGLLLVCSEMHRRKNVQVAGEDGSRKITAQSVAG
jgi:Family of unknown function (DUF5317)